MLTPTQVSQFRTQAGLSPTPPPPPAPALSQANDVISKRKAALTPTATPAVASTSAPTKGGLLDSFGGMKGIGGGLVDTLKSIYQKGIVEPSQGAANAVSQGLSDTTKAFGDIGNAKTPSELGGSLFHAAGDTAGTALSVVGSPLSVAAGALGNIPTPEGKNILGGQGKNVGESYQNTFIKPAGDLLANLPGLKELSQLPGVDKEVQRAINILTVGLASYFGAQNGEPNNGVGNEPSGTPEQIAGSKPAPPPGTISTSKLSLSQAYPNTLGKSMPLDDSEFKIIEQENPGLVEMVKNGTAEPIPVREIGNGMYEPYGDGGTRAIIAKHLGIENVPVKIVDSEGAASVSPKPVPGGDIMNLMGRVKDDIFPTPTVDEITGQIAQGRAGDIPNFQKGLSVLDTSKIKTYSDLSKSASDRVTALSRAQDKILSQDTTLRKMQQLALTEKGKGASVIHNYIKDAVGQLKELYTKTNDNVGLSKIKSIEARLDPIKGTGLSLKEVNGLARTYGSEFGTKAFSKMGDPLTSVNAQAFENTRRGVKNTVRNLLPDDTSRAIDSQMSSLYSVQRLSDKMATKVNALEQRLQKPSVLQKIGGIVGQGLRTTGIGDLASKLLGLDKVPGAKTLDAVEIESRLSKNLDKIDAALKEKNDTAFAKDIEALLSAE